MPKHWLPLEANPAVVSDFARTLGADTSGLAFCDVFSLDEEMLAFVPRPVAAVVLLFPITPEYEEARRTEDTTILASPSYTPPPAWFTHQTVGNACGTIAVLHSLAAARADGLVPAFAPDSFLARFYEATASMTPAERAAYLESPPAGAPDIEAAHAAAATRGDTAPPAPDASVDLHFVALVHAGGRLVELDGRKRCAVDHGPTTQETLLQDAARVAREFMARSPDSVQFNMMALAAVQD